MRGQQAEYVARRSPIAVVPSRTTVRRLSNHPPPFCRPLEVIEQVTPQPKQTQRAMNSIPANVPPPEEQAELVARVRALHALAAKVADRVEAATLDAGRLTQAVLSKAFRGELVETEAELAARDAANSSRPSSFWSASAPSGRPARQHAADERVLSGGTVGSWWETVPGWPPQALPTTR